MAIQRTDYGQARVVGLQYHRYRDHEAELADGTKLRLLAEPDNPHDPLAVAVYLGADQIGHLERDVAHRVAPLMRGDQVVAGYAAVVFHDPAASIYNRLVAQVIIATRQDDSDAVTQH